MPFLVTTAADGKKKTKDRIAELAVVGSWLWSFGNTTHDLSHTQQQSLYDGPYQFCHGIGCKKLLLARVNSIKDIGNCGKGCWPSAMMVNVRPCARVTHRAVEVDLSRVVESTPTVNLRRPSAKLVFICKLLRLDARRKLYFTAKTVIP